MGWALEDVEEPFVEQLPTMRRRFGEGDLDPASADHTANYE
jgi:hypothetical protein